MGFIALFLFQLFKYRNLFKLFECLETLTPDNQRCSQMKKHVCQIQWPLKSLTPELKRKTYGKYKWLDNYRY